MKGQRAKEGDIRWSQNGYQYTRLKDKWELTHRVIAEQKLERPLTADERVRFLDGNRTNFAPDNIEVFKVKKKTNEAKKARLTAKIAELQEMLKEL